MRELENERMKRKLSKEMGRERKKENEITIQRNGEGEKERKTENHPKKWGGRENERMRFEQ